MARLQTLKLPKGVEIDEVSNDNLFTHPSAGSVPTTLAVKDYLHDEIDKHDQVFWPDGIHRNAIINGNFDIWQRGTSFSANGYTADRWFAFVDLGTQVTMSRKTFAPGQTEVPGEPKYYFRSEITSSGDLNEAHVIANRIESVRSFAGQTVTVSFYAKSDGMKHMSVEFEQSFGAGGNPSPIRSGISPAKVSLTENWQRYDVSAVIPSISGKSVGTIHDGYLALHLWLSAGSNLNSRTVALGNQSGVFDIAQVQLNLGDKPLPFSPRPYAEELALCQRYYRREAAISEYSQFGSVGLAHTATRAYIPWPVAPSMRVPPTLSHAGSFQLMSGGSSYPVTAIYTGGSTTNMILTVDVASGLTPGQSVILLARNDLTCRLDFNAEL